MGIEQLKMYTQALRSNIHHLLSTLTPLDGFKGLETIKNPEKVRDCEQTDGCAHTLDLEEATNAEELCQAREERAEMKVCGCGVWVHVCGVWVCGVCVGVHVCAPVYVYRECNPFLG